MFTFILWGAIAVALFLAFKRIARGLTVTCVFIASLFFAIFLIDTVTMIPIRSIVSLGWYDETIENPQEVANKVGDKIKKGGEKAVDKVNEVGNEVDVKYGTADDKEWTKVEKEDKEKKPKKDKKAKQKKDKPKKVKKAKQGQEFVKYTNVKKKLKEEYRELTDKDKDIIKSFSTIYKTKIEGDDIIVWNNKDKSDEGIYIKLK